MSETQSREELLRWLRLTNDELKRLYQGMDVAYDMAMNDGGASIGKLTAKIEKLLARRDELVEAIGEKP